jgi:hypothetical protein
MSIAGVTGSSSAALAQELQRLQRSPGPGAAATTGSIQQAGPTSDDATAAVDTTA